MTFAEADRVASTEVQPEVKVQEAKGRRFVDTTEEVMAAYRAMAEQLANQAAKENTTTPQIAEPPKVETPEDSLYSQIKKARSY
jgi:hypothetical protein